MYPTESIAEEALIEAWTTYDYTHRSGPLGIYLCDVCGSYHLTSKGLINKKLNEYIASGKIKKSVEVENWKAKLKRKK